MKIQLAILFVCFLLILPGNANLSAQVTIGAKGPPGNGVLPDLKEKDVTEIHFVTFFPVFLFLYKF